MSAIKSSLKERYYEAVGRRKNAVARVRITPVAKLTITDNGKHIDAYFNTEYLRMTAQKALLAHPMENKFAVSAQINGGGIHGQAEALSHGLARALIVNDPAMRIPLKKAKLLTRDSRMKERRKFGLKKARKAPQWSKR